MSFGGGGSNPGFLQQLANGIMPSQGYAAPEVQQFINQVPQQQFQQYAQQGISQTAPQDYSNHITPGVGGTNPLGGLGSGVLGSLAGSLMGHLMSGQGNSPGMANQMGTQTTDPQQMNEQDVSQMAQYAQQHNPGALATTAAQYQNKPDVVQAVLGNKALTIALGGLAAAAMAGKLPGVTPKFGPGA